jgi:hypothetical protein
MSQGSVRVTERCDVTEQCDGIDAVTLAQNLGIGLDTIQKTLKAMTQRGVRTILNPTLSRQFRVNDRQLQNRCLLVDMFTDTMFSKVKSKYGNTCAQVFLTAKGWTHVYPMKKKSKAHEALSLLHQREGIPNVMVMDSSKEQLLASFITSVDRLAHV